MGLPIARFGGFPFSQAAGRPRLAFLGVVGISIIVVPLQSSRSSGASTTPNLTPFGERGPAIRTGSSSAADCSTGKQPAPPLCREFRPAYRRKVQTGHIGNTREGVQTGHMGNDRARAGWKPPK